MKSNLQTWITKVDSSAWALYLSCIPGFNMDFAVSEASGGCLSQNGAILSHFFFPKPDTGSTPSEGGLSGGEWGAWQLHLFSEAYTASCIQSTAQSYSPLTPAVFPPAIPRTLPLRIAAAVFVGLPAAHMASVAVIFVSRGDECSAAITSTFFLGWLISAVFVWSLHCSARFHDRLLGSLGISVATTPFHPS